MFCAEVVLLGKNWKPFHLKGLKGSKEHQITLPVVFFFSSSGACNKLRLCRTQPLSGRGWGNCPQVQTLETLSASKWGLLYFTPWPKAKKEPRRKNRKIYDTSRPTETPQLGNEEARTAEWAENEVAYCRGFFFLTLQLLFGVESRLIHCKIEAMKFSPLIMISLHHNV